MIPRRSKFPMRTDFLAFRAKAKQSATPHLRTFYAPHTPSRLAVVVPAKVSKLASTRTKLKRLIYDHFWPTLVGKNLDYVIMYKPLSLNKNAHNTIITELKELSV